MSARLKLKKLARETEFIRDSCRRREAEARSEIHTCHKLLQENIVEIGAITELCPCDMMCHAVDCLDVNVREVTDSIVRKYAEHLAEYARNQLMTKYRLNRFSTFRVRLFAPAINEEHIKVEIREVK